MIVFTLQQYIFKTRAVLHVDDLCNASTDDKHGQKKEM